MEDPPNEKSWENNTINVINNLVSPISSSNKTTGYNQRIFKAPKSAPKNIIKELDMVCLATIPMAWITD